MLSEEIIRSFNVSGEKIPLLGGQNTSVRVNHAVFKPVDDMEYTEWLLTVIDSIRPQGYRLSKPLRTQKGTFVSDGWVCTQFERGQEVNGKINEKLHVSRLFHRDISNLNVENCIQVQNPWAMAHHIAWQRDEMPPEVHPKTKLIINELLSKVQLQEQYNLQIVHGDLAGNILFDDVFPPLIIDFSPTVAPVEYAEAILVCDCIAWQGSEVFEIEVLSSHGSFIEMIIRAIVFRLAVEAIFAKSDHTTFEQQYHLFKPILDYIDL